MIKHSLSDALESSVATLGASAPVELRPGKAGHGHYQSAVAFALAKELKRSPLDLAQEVTSLLNGDPIFAALGTASASAPGFVNITVSGTELARVLNRVSTDPHLGAGSAQPQSVVIDYSSPNVAKEMQVWHLRSSVIGDALANTLEFLGHAVTRVNHVGDWGTQFGMLVEQFWFEGLTLNDLDLPGLSALYVRARKHFEADAEFASASRNRVVALQAGDPDTLEVWAAMVEVSVDAFSQLYDRMGSGLQSEHVRGESSYNDLLADVVEELEGAGLLTRSEGALCAFLPGFVARDGSALPLLVQKSDGGYGYAATDLAALRSRVQGGADRVLYVVDARQKLHFEQVFALAAAAGWTGEAELTHVPFGTVLGPDGKPFKTRNGVAVTLESLLDEAEAAAGALMAERELPVDDALASQIGIGAVKYADLSAQRVRDYTFSIERMVALDGDTGPYLQYAHARLCSLLKKGGGAGSITELTHPSELDLAVALEQFPDVLEEVARTLEPHRLTTYLYSLASTTSAFYENCPVLPSTGAVRASRLGLCDLTRRTLNAGLGILGIAAPSAM